MANKTIFHYGPRGGAQHGQRGAQCTTPHHPQSVSHVAPQAFLQSNRSNQVAARDDDDDLDSPDEAPYFGQSQSSVASGRLPNRMQKPQGQGRYLLGRA